MIKVDDNKKKNASENTFFGYKIGLSNDLLLSLANLLLEGSKTLREDVLSLHQPPISVKEFSEDVESGKIMDGKNERKSNFLVVICRQLFKAIASAGQKTRLDNDQMQYLQLIRGQLKTDFTKGILTIRVFENNLTKKGLDEVSLI